MNEQDKQDIMARLDAIERQIAELVKLVKDSQSKPYFTHQFNLPVAAAGYAPTFYVTVPTVPAKEWSPFDANCSAT
jgi:hypothetical protein